MNIYQIALTLIPGLGNKGIRQLLEICNSPEQIYQFSHSQLKEIFGRHLNIISAIESKSTMAEAERQMAQLERIGAHTLFCTEPDYPRRLNETACEDTPVLLYRMGQCDLNTDHTLAMVGSRKATDYGRTTTARLIQEMIGNSPLIVSGLAYGIDYAAHTAALETKLPTAAVLGHGLEMIYPREHAQLARRIITEGGCLLSEFCIGTPINPANFPARNRIIAALSDATVVVEAAERGGALITANIANGYNREVFAVPGRLTDPCSAGCNSLITDNKAIAIRNAGDIFFQMGWKNTFNQRTKTGEQQSLFAQLTANEQKIASLLREHGEMRIDELVQASGLSLPKTAATLINLELNKVIRCLPGRLYKLY